MNRTGFVRARGRAAVFSLLLGAACTTRESADAGATGAEQPVRATEAAPGGANASVCPGCEPEGAQRVAGGESSDFEGSLDECVGFLLRDPVRLDEADPPGFDLPALRQILERDFSASFAWVPEPPWVAGNVSFDATTLTGFSPETTITGSIHLPGSGTYLHLDPARCDVDAGICPVSDPLPREVHCGFRKAPGWLVLDVEVSLRTGDGAIELLATPGSAVVRSARPIAVPVDLLLDLTQLHGGLRLEPAHPGPYVGSLSVSISATPAGLRGAVSTRLGPADWSEDWVGAPLNGRWPKEDDCRPEELPIDGTTEAGQTALELMGEVFSRLRERTRAASPRPARWAGPLSLDDAAAETELTIEVSDRVQPGCIDVDGRFLSFSASAHLTTADGRVDVSTPLLGGGGYDEEGTWADASLSWSWSETFTSEAAFRSAGFAIELFGSKGADVQLDDYYQTLSSSFYDGGSLFVRAVPECSLDPRCAGSAQPCDQCGEPLVVDQLLWGISARY